MSNKIIIVSWGGIGDAIVSLPAIRALKEKDPSKKIILFYRNMGHEAVFRNNPYIDALHPVKLSALLFRPAYLAAFLVWRYPGTFLAKVLNRWKVDYVLMHFQHIPLTWIYKKNVIDIVPDMFNVTLRSRKIELFFTEQEVAAAKEKLKPYKNVIFMHIHSKASPNHHWNITNWEELVQQLPEYTFIQFGGLNEQLVKGAVDWRGGTILREALCLLQQCDSFVGVDSSFSHATAAFQTPGVVLFGDSDPMYWGHSNNINVYKAVECSPCYYELWGRSCPYGNKCMKQISVDDVKQSLMRQMSKRRAAELSPAV